MAEFTDVFLEDFTSRSFRQCFQLYFEELGYNIKDWDGLFREFDEDGRDNRGYLRMDGERPVGFIQFCDMELNGWFFTKKLGFIREFWIAPEYRGQGHGTVLLAFAEKYFAQRNAAGMILTTDTAPGFYEKHGYYLDLGFTAKNHEPVYVKSFPSLTVPAGQEA